MRHEQKFKRGFTLVEMVVVIAIIGILGGVIAVFVGMPVQDYVDSARRAAMTDIADTAALRLARDIRTAVPYSVRVSSPAGANTYIEFLPTKAGGRYRADADMSVSGVGPCGGTLADDILDFTVADSCFEIIGPALTFAAGDQIVVGNTLTDVNAPYQLTNSASSVRRDYTGVFGVEVRKVLMAATVKLPTPSPGNRFEVVPGEQQAVTYACTGTLGTLDANNDGQAKLMRYWHYDFQPTQQLPAAIIALATHSEAVLADKISACDFRYDAGNRLVSVTLTITRNHESIKLYQEIYVSNTP